MLRMNMLKVQMRITEPYVPVRSWSFIEILYLMFFAGRAIMTLIIISILIFSCGSTAQLGPRAPHC